MSVLETHPAQPKAPAPKLAVRLVLWWGIFVGASVWLAGAILWKAFGSYVRDGGLWGFGLAPLIFSWGLGLPPVAELARNCKPLAEAAILDGAIALSYILYVVHLWFTCNAKTRRVFFFVMIIFIVIVGLNVAGCRTMLPLDNATSAGHIP